MNLSQLQQAVQNIYPNAVLPDAYMATVDAAGNASISLWNNGVGAQPSVDQLNTAWANIQLAQAKASQQIAVTGAYDRARWGTQVSITASSGATLTFPVDSATQTNIMGYVAAFAVAGSAAAPAGGLPLLDASNTIQWITVADVQALAGAIAAQSIAAFNTYFSLLGQISLATAVADVQAIVWPTA